ncbi:hypothetical protein HDU85_003862 [Gaertneriomyces sp. JEL0708]|nr:hypothetical protein HDU85_003862 [Gaertneriomyces sp. JEL0708]
MLSSFFAPSGKILSFSFLLGLATSASVNAQAPGAGACFSLSTTQTCTSWTDGSVQVSQNFSTVPQFDQYINTLYPEAVTHVPTFRTQYQCPRWDGSGLRYQVSLTCALLVDISTANGCQQPAHKPMCRSTAQQALDSIKAVWADTTLCTPGVVRQLATNLEFFLTNMNTDANCIPAANFEWWRCGFATEAQAATYCRTSDDPCCEAYAARVAKRPFTVPTQYGNGSTVALPNPVSNTPSNSPGATTTPVGAAQVEKYSTPSKTAIIIASCAGGVLIAIISTALYLASKKKKKEEAGSGLFPTNSDGFNLGRPLSPTVDTLPSPFAAKGDAMRSYNAGPSEMEQASRYDRYDSGMPRESIEYQNDYVGGNNGDYPAPVLLPPLTNVQSPPSSGSTASPKEPASSGSPIIPSNSIDNAPSMNAAGLGAAPILSPSGPTPQEPRPSIVIHPYIPNLSDEIYLSPNDRVLLKCTFDDGWGYGLNLNTQQEGSFPLACVISTDAEASHGPQVNFHDSYISEMSTVADGQRDTLNSIPPTSSARPRLSSLYKSQMYDSQILSGQFDVNVYSYESPTADESLQNSLTSSAFDPELEQRSLAAPYNEVMYNREPDNIMTTGSGSANSGGPARPSNAKW